MCLIAIRHRDGLVFAKVDVWIGVIWRGDSDGVDVRDGARVAKFGVVRKSVDERWQFGDVKQVDLRSWICLISVEVIIETLYRGSETNDARRRSLRCYNGSGTFDSSVHGL